MSRIALVQPRAGERISGGYLYNAQMAAHGAWDLISVGLAELPATLATLDHDLVIADSIWLTPEAAPALTASPRRLGAMLHSFPSMIEAAESGRPLRATPSAFEVQVLARLGLAVTPGPHYAEMLEGIEVAVCEPGVEQAWRSPPRPRRAEGCALISVGAVTPRKGFGDALDQLPANRELHWTVVGSLDAAPDYARAVTARAAGDSRVSFIGQRTPDEVRALVRESDVLVMPSYDENHPLVILEAIAASVPTVAYAAGAAARMLGHGEGLVADIGDGRVLGEHLHRVVSDEAARFAMAEACWRRQASLPGWEGAAREARARLEALLR
jgi:glycosyltransferase involved in cell wall biosynthesis